MTLTPDPPEGIGNPATGQPVFVPPVPPTGPPGPTWTAPDPGTRVTSAPPEGTSPDRRPPTGRAPQHRPPGRRALVAAVLVGALLLTALLSAQPLLLSTGPVPSTAPPTGAAVVVTVSPSAAPTAASSRTAGGGIGEAAAFTAPHGTGTLTVTGVTWTDSGEAPPVDGERYLVVDLTVRCTGGEVPVDPVLFAASTGAGTALPGFGPALTRPLGGRLLAGGDDVSGQLGFALAPGAVDLVLLDEDLHVLATVEIPAP